MFILLNFEDFSSNLNNIAGVKSFLFVIEYYQILVVVVIVIVSLLDYYQLVYYKARYQIMLV
jgi:hypothetical protein